jgi:hypothetical protein
MHGHFRILVLLATSTLLIAANYAIADAESDEDLLTLARNHFDYRSITSEPQRKVFDTFFQTSNEAT